ncbi:uncharacterized protein CLUP02_17933 [Colletotrichum lupini]|uniref:Uncharacterized protein n=1 Tax=Colletotrichum lupini TaxID=145971 RepID=A0A9Q8SG93_9PEZI|nr:uncharacterized protein CLUP02_17933 [Colletotrichum lupini]UQC76420.1 hypothetical protein CLUP02_17933 [Colletotrichum lupini]
MAQFASNNGFPLGGLGKFVSSFCSLKLAASFVYERLARARSRHQRHELILFPPARCSTWRKHLEFLIAICDKPALTAVRESFIHCYLSQTLGELLLQFKPSLHITWAQYCDDS